MTWIIGITIFVSGLLIGMGLVAYRFSTLIKNDTTIPELERNKAMDLSALLAVYRREIANYLILNNPKKFLKTYKKIEKQLRELDRSDKETLNARRLILTKKYPQYSDFDSLGTYDYALYSECYSGNEDDLVECYTDNIILHHLNYLLIKKNGMSLWEALPRNDDNDYIKHLKEYTDRIEDTKLQQMLILAFQEFELNKPRLNKINSKNRIWYKSSWFSVYYIPWKNPSTEYGFHFHQINEFGIVETYEESIFYYRSDLNFEKSNHLNNLNIERLILPIPFVKHKN